MSDSPTIDREEPLDEFRWLNRDTLQQLWRVHLKPNPANLSCCDEWRTTPSKQSS